MDCRNGSANMVGPLLFGRRGEADPKCGERWFFMDFYRLNSAQLATFFLKEGDPIEVESARNSGRLMKP